MADVEEPQFNSLADRIAALNKQKNFTAPPPATKRAPPPPPPGKKNHNVPEVTAAAKPSPTIPALPQRTNTTNSIADPPTLPRRDTSNTAPPLPNRTDSSQTVAPTPTLPPRRPTHQLGERRDSSSSVVSHVSTISNLSLSRTSTNPSSDSPAARRVLAPTLDQTKLPPLPPSRREKEAKAANEAAERKSTAVIQPPSLPVRPATANPASRPQLPSRPSTTSQNNDPSQPGPRRLPPPASAFIKPKTGLEGSSRPPPIPTNRPSASNSPPPVPLSSRPTFAQVDAVAVRAAANQAAVCLACRDFSAPDSVGAQYPRETLPRSDPVGFLAHHLCSPFPSATDKARAIFTWCHHNISYNVEEFFGKCVKGRDVDETMFLGKAVCQGYAEVFQAIAQRAGLQCLVVGGHGKGYGYTPLTRGQAPPPRDPSGHAWNVVCIDNGEWKLLDACWGAGHLGPNNSYTKKFSPKMFTFTNERFGETHFPRDDRHFYREDGRVLNWEEYMIGSSGTEQPHWFGDVGEEGLSQFGYSPAAKHLSVYSGDVVRFQFAKVCEHWTHERNGKGLPYLLLLKIHGVDGRKDDMIPLDADGYWWWADVPSRDLGAPGQQVQLLALTKINDDDARGTTKERFYQVKGRCGMAWAIWCVWDLV
ncbi:hypothetical protein F5Y16DRAFT_381681 [Xylariaceae sp. FL0255]|nr:hypothetical protein F5Y16DRAFT_381681 [Xylariaceae sp. FL0255]